MYTLNVKLDSGLIRELDFVLNQVVLDAHLSGREDIVNLVKEFVSHMPYERFPQTLSQCSTASMVLGLMDEKHKEEIRDDRFVVSGFVRMHFTDLLNRIVASEAINGKDYKNDKGHLSYLENIEHFLYNCSKLNFINREAKESCRIVDADFIEELRSSIVVESSRVKVLIEKDEQNK